MARFFLATVMGGRLHPNGISEGPWDATRLHWWPEDRLDLILPTTREQKVRTPEELDHAITEPMTVAPTRDIWIHERLEDEAAGCGSRWSQISKRGLGRNPHTAPGRLLRWSMEMGDLSDRIQVKKPATAWPDAIGDGGAS